nr:hypothetical protein BJQ95_00859 [Cryobacterium sp. SO1]
MFLGCSWRLPHVFAPLTLSFRDFAGLSGAMKVLSSETKPSQQLLVENCSGDPALWGTLDR